MSTNKQNTTTEVKQTEWRLPDFMAENLVLIQREFSKEYQRRIGAYIKEIKDNYRNYEDMPNEESEIVIDIDNKRITLREAWVAEQKAKEKEGGQQQGA